MIFHNKIELGLGCVYVFLHFCVTLAYWCGLHQAKAKVIFRLRFDQKLAKAIELVGQSTDWLVGEHDP